MREIVLDTETTGLDPYAGDRLVEIGCVELINHVQTGEIKQWYINPERDIPDEAVKIHGLTSEFLKDKPKFNEVADEFLDFIGSDVLVIHNASFDMRFINAELAWINRKDIKMSQVIDTLDISRRKFPGKRNSLDALCQRFNIDNSHRTLHGALLDASILADVYLELIGGREPSFGLDKQVTTIIAASALPDKNTPRKYLEPRNFPVPEEDLQNHRLFIEKSVKESLWLKKTGE